MRFAELSLIAFGPFTDRVLDLSGGAGLHVIHGPNEAGKTTTLRAITGLLFGIPRNTSDGHIHPMPKLRVGARVLGADGKPWAVVRHKRDKASLTDDAGTPIDDATWRRLLAGTTPELFASMFGLDHVRLREGAAELLRAGGNVGESLFDAALGGRGIHRVLAELRAERDELFKANPRAKTTLAGAMDAYKDAKKELDATRLKPKKWREQEDGLAQARQALAELETRRRELGAERARLERIKRARDDVSLRVARLDEQASLSGARRLPDNFAERRVAAERDIDEATRELGRIGAEIATLAGVRASLQVPEDLVALDERRMNDLHKRLGAFDHNQRDLPSRRRELAVAEETARSILKRLGRAGDADDLSPLAVDVAVEKRLRQLARSAVGVEQALAGARGERDDLVARRAGLAARLEELPPARDATALTRAVDAARRLGAIDDQIAKAERKLADERGECARRLATLGAWSDSLAALVALVVPSAETCQRFEAAFDALAADEKALEQQARSADKQRRDARRRLEELQGAGEVPTEAQLTDARRKRDDIWVSVRRELGAGGALTDERAAGFENAVGDADSVADRLRREARRVEQVAAQLAAAADARRELDATEQERGALATRRTGIQADWQSAWQEASVAPLTPREMVAWLARRAELVTAASRADAAAMELQALAHQRDAACAALATAIGADAIGGVLAALLDQAQGELDACDSRRSLDSEIAELDVQVQAATKKLERAEAAHAEWKRTWAAATAAIALGPDALADEVDGVLEARQELGQIDESMRRLRHRIDGMQTQVDDVVADVAGLVSAHAPDLQGVGTAEAADQLLQRYAVARQNRVSRDGADAQALKLRADEARERARLELSLRTLDELMGLAGVADRAGLDQAERRSKRLRDLEGELRAIEDRLRALGEGTSVDELVAEVSASDHRQVLERLDAVEREQEDLDAAWKDKHQEVVGLQLGLHQLEDGDTDKCVAELESHTVVIRDLVDRYVRVRLAISVLEREVERFREQSQDPILSRASALFPRLTLGAYQKLSAVLDDKNVPVLRCMRQDGTLVDVEALSDGTRDQLYLALRLAALERHAETNDALPLILDDVLINFDEQRTSAAFSVLGELSERIQILFFTHHARLVELARAAVPADRLVVHELAQDERTTRGLIAGAG